MPRRGHRTSVIEARRLLFPSGRQHRREIREAGQRVLEETDTGQRGSGRTTRQLEALEPGMTYVVHSRSLEVHVRRLIEDVVPQVRPVSLIVAATAEDVCSILRGTSRIAVADHACPAEVRWAVDEHTRNLMARA